MLGTRYLTEAKYAARRSYLRSLRASPYLRSRTARGARLYRNVARHPYRYGAAALSLYGIHDTYNRALPRPPQGRSSSIYGLQPRSSGGYTL